MRKKLLQRHLWHTFLGFRDGFGGILVVLQLARAIGFVGSHVEMTVTAEIEEDHSLLAGCFGLQRLVDRAANGVAAFGRGNNPLGAGELDRSLKDAQLMIS